MAKHNTKEPIKTPKERAVKNARALVKFLTSTAGIQPVELLDPMQSRGATVVSTPNSVTVARPISPLTKAITAVRDLAERRLAASSDLLAQVERYFTTHLSMSVNDMVIYWKTDSIAPVEDSMSTDIQVSLRMDTNEQRLSKRPLLNRWVTAEELQAASDGSHIYRGLTVHYVFSGRSSWEWNKRQFETFVGQRMKEWNTH